MKAYRGNFENVSLKHTLEKENELGGFCMKKGTSWGIPMQRSL